MFKLLSAREFQWSTRAARSWTALALLALVACAKGQSQEDAAALASAREAQIRAEAELKVMKELAAKAQATPAATTVATPADSQEPAPAIAPALTPASEPKAATNPLPDAARVKGDLIGRTISGGLLKKYKFQTLDEILAFRVAEQQQSGDVAEFTSTATLRKEVGSLKKCFTSIRSTYRRTGPDAPWSVATVQANTLTCE